MKIFTQSLGVVSFVALGSFVIGCAGSPPSDDDGGSKGSGGRSGIVGGGSGGGGSGMTGPMLGAKGTYALTSTYDVSTNMPGEVGTIVNDFIAATDGPNDPTQWLLQLLVNELPSGTVQTIANSALPFISSYLNDQLFELGADFVGDIKTVGQDFGDMAKKLGINETYIVMAAGSDYTALDTATGVHFTIGSVAEDFDFVDYKTNNVVVNGVDPDGRNRQADNRPARPADAVRQDPQRSASTPRSSRSSIRTRPTRIAVRRTK